MSFVFNGVPFEREIKIGKEQERINTELETAENRIDSEAYKFYELSEKDIAMIENEIQ